MRPLPALFLSCMVLLTVAVGRTCLAAEPVAGAGVTIEQAGMRMATVTGGDLGKLPAIQVTAAFGNGQGGKPALFEGPLLWTVLTEAHAVTFAKPGDQVRQVVVLTGRDGYTAVLGLGEISPEFEGKQVILAGRMDGKPLGPDHLRVIVPGDGKAGRSVRDIVAVAVLPLPPSSH